MSDGTVVAGANSFSPDWVRSELRCTKASLRGQPTVLDLTLVVHNNEANFSKVGLSERAVGVAPLAAARGDADTSMLKAMEEASAASAAERGRDGGVQKCRRGAGFRGPWKPCGPLSSRTSPGCTCPHLWPLSKSRQRSQHLQRRSRCRPARSATPQSRRRRAKRTLPQPSSTRAQSCRKQTTGSHHRHAVGRSKQDGRPNRSAEGTRGGGETTPGEQKARGVGSVVYPREVCEGGLSRMVPFVVFKFGARRVSVQRRVSAGCLIWFC